MSEDKKLLARLRTTNWREYNAALKALGSLTVWLNKDMQCLAEPNGNLGIDPQTLEIRAIEAANNSVSAEGVYDTKACHAG